MVWIVKLKCLFLYSRDFLTLYLLKVLFQFLGFVHKIYEYNPEDHLNTGPLSEQDKKLIVENSNANVISKELKINTKTKLSNMEFSNVGNSKGANHFKDVFAMILTNVMSKVQNDILTQKIRQKFENKLKNLKQDILKDLLKENPKDLFNKFDKLFK